MQDKKIIPSVSFTVSIIEVAKHALACKNLLNKYGVGFEIEQGMCVINLRQLKMYFRGGRVGGRFKKEGAYVYLWLINVDI